MKSYVLIVDDDVAVCVALKLLLKRAKMESYSINSPKELFPTIAKRKPDLIILDMNFAIETSGKAGLATLQKILAAYPDMPVILMTGWATVQLAVQGMKLGAKDFLAKPWDNKQLLRSIKTILALESKAIGEINDTTNFEYIIGEHTNFKAVVATAKRVAKTNASVLIVGESGVGKELIAEAIHYESLRAEQAFVKVNLGGISSSLFESELFGHKKGAFTDAYADRKGRFELADKGTIFLDEIGDLALASQVKLLRVLQESTFEVLGSSQTRKIDVRVISATNKDLEQMIEAGSFREDLYYRINLIKIEIPPLRARPSDIPLVAQFFVNNLKITYDRPDLQLSKNARDWLSQQKFPGNIRQLKNLVERTTLMTSEDLLEAEDFKQFYRTGTNKKDTKLDLIPLEEMEIKMIQKALSHHKGVVSAAARSLGITRSAMYRRLQKYGIEV